METIVSIVIFLFLLWIGLLPLIGLWKMFNKMGHSGIFSIIPIVNIFMLTKKTFGSGWYFLLLLVPIVDLVFAIVLASKTSKSFGRGFGTTLGLIFLTPIFYIILGFGDAEYLGVWDSKTNTYLTV